MHFITTITIVALAAIAVVNAAAVPVSSTNEVLFGNRDIDAQKPAEKAIGEARAVDLDLPDLKTIWIDAGKPNLKPVFEDPALNSDLSDWKEAIENRDLDGIAHSSNESLRKIKAAGDLYLSRGLKRPQHWYDCLFCSLGMVDGNYFRYPCIRCDPH